jgi:hypothetical protein
MFCSPSFIYLVARSWGRLIIHNKIKKNKEVKAAEDYTHRKKSPLLKKPEILFSLWTSDYLSTSSNPTSPPRDEAGFSF